MYPTRDEALSLLAEAEARNPGPWGNHSRTVAHCAERIAALSGMDPDKAYALGLLHDIGRRFGKRHLGHVSDGYSYMMSLALTTRRGSASPTRSTGRKSRPMWAISTPPRPRPS